MFFPHRVPRTRKNCFLVTSKEGRGAGQRKRRPQRKKQELADGLGSPTLTEELAQVVSMEICKLTRPP